MSDTYFPKAGDIKAKWFLVDAQDVVLGRLSTAVARVLTGKNKPTYTPHADTGDFVIVVNAGKIRMTGRKTDDKMYHSHTGYMGGMKSVPAGKMLARWPDRVIYEAVKGMLPHNKLGRKLIKKLKIYGGADHPHQAQMPEPLTVAARSK